LGASTTGGGSSLTSGFGGSGGGAVMKTTFSSTGAAWAARPPAVRKFGGEFGVIREQVIFEVLGGDLIERTGRDLGGGNAQRLGFGDNFLVLQAKFLRDVVNPNGHIFLSSPNRAGQPCRPKIFPAAFIRPPGCRNHFHQAESSDVRLQHARLSNIRRLFADLAECCSNHFHPLTTNPRFASNRHAPAHRPVRVKRPECGD